MSTDEAAYRHLRRLLASAVVAIGFVGCSSDGFSSAAACAQLKEVVALPAADSSVLARVTGPNPNVLDVLVRPWHPENHVRVYLLPDRSSEVVALADELRQAGFAVTATIDQSEAFHEFGVLFRERPEVVQGVGPEDLPASVQVDISTAAEQSNIDNAVRADPRVKEVVDEAVVVGRFAGAAFRVIEDRVDRLVGLLPAERRSDVQTLRTLGIQANADSLHPDVAQEAVRAAGRLTDFAVDECELSVKRG